MDKGVQLFHDDCLEVLPTLPAGCVDMVLCDLPYGTTACKWDSIIPFEPLWEQYRRLIKPNGVVCLFASQPFTSALVMSNPKWFRHEWIWIKDRGSNFANTVREPMKEHEQILVFSPGKWTYNRQMQERTGAGKSRVKYDFQQKITTEVYNSFSGEGRRDGNELRVPSSWQKFNRETGLHPTQKPVALLAYLIRTYTNEGETVLDNAMGSGSTGEACGQTGRDFIGIEKELEYYEIAKRRIEASRNKPHTTKMDI